MEEGPQLVEGEDFYREGAAIVFTARYHLRRGHCCLSDCRHCPYGEDAATRGGGDVDEDEPAEAF